MTDSIKGEHPRRTIEGSKFRDTLIDNGANIRSASTIWNAIIRLHQAAQDEWYAGAFKSEIRQIFPERIPSYQYSRPTDWRAQLCIDPLAVVLRSTSDNANRQRYIETVQLESIGVGLMPILRTSVAELIQESVDFDRVSHAPNLD